MEFGSNFAIIGLIAVIFPFPVFSQGSLFDDLPLNGALILTEGDVDYSSEAKNQPKEVVEVKVASSEVVNSEPKNLGSLFDQLPNQGAFNGKESKRKTRDSVDFDVTKITPSNEFHVPYWDKAFLAPMVNAIAGRDQKHQKPQQQRHQYQKPLVLRGPHPPRNFLTHQQYGPPMQMRRFHNTNSGWNNQPQAQPQPQREESSNNKTYQVSANSGGPTVIVYAHPKDKKEPTTPPEPVKKAEEGAKNEIHYHYHINSPPEESKPKPQPPPPQGYRPHPRPPMRGPSPGYSSGPPPPPLQRSHGWSPPPSVTSAPSNTYSIIERHRTAPTEVTYSSAEFDDDFSRRTFGPPRRPPPPPKTPSTSYEIPPNSNAPSGSSAYGQKPDLSYGPPPASKPDTAYGPPPPPTAPPAPPPQPQQDAGGDQFETTITLQTIPITRQVTELVQVPNVVHKISSNRPIQQEQQDEHEESSTYPSLTYGPPAPPPSKKQKQPLPQRQNINSQTGNFKFEAERPFESHLSQIFGTQSQSMSQPQNSNALLQELLLGQSRNPGFDLTLNDLELLTLLQRNSQNQNQNKYGGLLSSRNVFPILSGGQGQGWGGGNLNLNSNLNSISNFGGTSDSFTSVREAIREQRLQLALSDLRKQLREQNRDSQKERSSYRSLFTKGAMLLSALSIIPSMMGGASGGMAAAAGLNSANLNIPNIMLPVTNAMGRRKRSTTGGGNFDKLELISLGKCAQRELCEFVMESGRYGKGLWKIYGMLFEDLEKNLWLRDPKRAAEKKNCKIFSCQILKK